MIGVLDVLLHQLPIARNALTRIAENCELPAVEQTIEIAQDLWPEIAFQWFDLVVEGREDDAVSRSHLQLGQRMVGRLEIGRHPTANLSILFKSSSERHAEEVAL